MKRKFAVGAILVVVGLFSGIFVQTLISRESIYDQMEKFKFVFNTAIKNYVDNVDPGVLTEAAIKGMLNELDPHSVYISAEEMKAVNEDMQGSFDGIGVQFDMLNDTITVISPISGGPSESVGIMAGDKIVKIDGETAVGISRDSVPRRLRGAKGTIVKLDVYRPGNPNLLNFTVVRDKIPLFTVDGSYLMEDSDIGVIVINRFAATTYSEMMEAARKLKEQGMKKLVLDLRGNPGGYLNQAYMVADEFLPRNGDTIVFTKGRSEEFSEVYTTRNGNELEQIPLVVLISAGSASASEIVSGAIQDLDRGLIVGTTSFGKGLVQRQIDIKSDGSAFRLTISRYYTPSGRCIQRPFKDKVGYRHLLGRMELEEGANIDHILEKIKKDMKTEKSDKGAKTEKEKSGKDKNSIDIDSIPIYHTKSGRTVLGGGGITPDYVIKSDTLTDFGVNVRSKNVFNEYINNYMHSGKQIKEQYKGDFKAFMKNFEVTEKDLKEFKKLAEAKGVKWNDKEYDIDKDWLKITIKALVASVAWDRSAQMQVFSKIDRQLQKASTLFPEAEKIAKRRK